MSSPAEERRKAMKHTKKVGSGHINTHPAQFHGDPTDPTLTQQWKHQGQGERGAVSHVDMNKTDSKGKTDS